MKNNKNKLLAPPTKEELAQSSMFAPPTEEELNESKPSDLMGATSAGLQQMGRSAGFGLTDHMGAAVDVLTDSLLKKIAQHGLDDKLKDQGFTINEPEMGYAEHLASRQNLEKQQKEEFPAATLTGDIAGLLAGGGIVGNAGKQIFGRVLPSVARVAEVSPKVLSKIGMGAQASGLGARMAQAGAEGIAIGGASGVKPAIEGDLGAIPHEAMVGGAISAAFPIAGSVLRSVRRLPKQILSSLGGVSERNIGKYLVEPELVAQAKTFEDVKGLVDETVGKIKADFENATLTRQQAEAAFNAMKEDTRYSLMDKKVDATRLLDEAKQKLATSFQTEKELLKSTPPPIHMVDDILESNRQVKNKLIEESNKATNLLGLSKENIAKKPIVDLLKEEVANLKSSVSEADHAAASKLEAYIERFKAKPELLSMKDTKEIIKQLDKDINYNHDSGAFNDSVDQVLTKVRRGIDGTVKELVPEYKVAMENSVQPLAQLRSDVAKLYGTPEKVRAKLLRLDNPAMQNERDVLNKLGEVTNKDFESPLTAYQSAKSKLASPSQMDALKMSLPENKQVLTAQGNVAEIEAGMDKRSLQALHEASPEYRALKQAELMEQQSKEAADQFKTFGEQNTQGKIQAIMSGRSIEAKKTMQKLSEYSDVDFVSEIEKLQLASAFDKTFMHGSRNVNLWGMLGMAAESLKSPKAAAGGTAGLFLGPFMAGLGVVTGAMVDMYGPRATKAVLNGVLKIQGIPTVQKISQIMADVPPGLRNEIIDSLRRTLVADAVEPELQVPPPLRLGVIQDVMNSNALTDSEKAKSISKINKDGGFPHYRKFIAGDEVKTVTVPGYLKKPESNPKTVQSVAEQIQKKKRLDF